GMGWAGGEPPPRGGAAPPGPPARRGPRAAAVAAGLAAAAALLLFVRPSGERLKGTGFALGMFVEHAEQVRRAGPGVTVAPEDAVRFTVTAPVESYVAVLSLDPAGHTSIYFPLGGGAQAVGHGKDDAHTLGPTL